MLRINYITNSYLPISMCWPSIGFLLKHLQNIVLWFVTERFESYHLIDILRISTINCIKWTSHFHLWLLFDWVSVNLACKSSRVKMADAETKKVPEPSLKYQYITAFVGMLKKNAVCLFFKFVVVLNKTQNNKNGHRNMVLNWWMVSYHNVFNQQWI